MKRLAGLLLGGAAVLASACASSPDGPAMHAADDDDPYAPAALEASMRAYVEDPRTRRAALVWSLVRDDNGYARKRLALYDETHWGALPEFNPRTTPLTLDDDGAIRARPPLDAADWSVVDLAGDDMSLETLRAIGERAFFDYPTQGAPGLERALATEDRAGMWTHEGRTSAVWTVHPHDLIVPTLTCSTCHASTDGPRLIPGRNAADLDVGRLYGDGERGEPWGIGRVDVTEDGADNPVAISDLRPVRYQKNLHRAATLRNDPIALAVRIETLIITSLGEAVRPPRKLVAGLTVYLLSLAPPPVAKEVKELPGAAVFMRECGRCHASEGRSGAAVPLATVGTDPAVGSSRERGTGFYRVPSLRAVGDRRRMFASGGIEDLDALLDPERSVVGHRFGLSLDDADRVALLAYLRAL